MTHDIAICTRDVKGTQYVGKSYKSEFTCPMCLRSTWQHLGFLGQRNVCCNGEKFSKADKTYTIADLQEIGF